MTIRRTTTHLSEEGRRELAHFLADNLSDFRLIDLLVYYEAFVSFESREQAVQPAALLEIPGSRTRTGNPVTRIFSGDALVFSETHDG